MAKEDVNEALDDFLGGEKIEVNKEQTEKSVSEPAPMAEPKAEPAPMAEPKVEPAPMAEPKAEPVVTEQPKTELATEQEALKVEVPEMVIPTMDDDFKAKLSEKTPQQKAEEFGIKCQDDQDGKTLTIKSWEFTKPKTTEFYNGQSVPIPPKNTKPEDVKNGSLYYDGKLKIWFEDNLVEYFSSVKYWVNNNKISPDVEIWRDGNNKVSNIFRQIIVAMSGNKLKLKSTTVNERATLVPENYEEFKAFEKDKTDKEVLDFLIGKKVLISISRGKAPITNREWTRADIQEIMLE